MNFKKNYQLCEKVIISSLKPRQEYNNITHQIFYFLVIQYGFVVMFATAFPLAPLCALLNNILEQRLDAYKMVVAQRRPIPGYYCTNKSNLLTSASCCDNCTKLGEWIRVIKVLSMISVLYNVSILKSKYIYIILRMNLNRNYTRVKHT